MLAKMTRYKVIVLGLKPRKNQSDDGMSVEDVFFGFSHTNHKCGKFLDLWFTEKHLDPDNFVTFGRILCIDGDDRERTYYTKLGKFYVEVMDDTTERKDASDSSSSRIPKKLTRSEGYSTSTPRYSSKRVLGSKALPRSMGNGHDRQRH